MTKKVIAAVAAIAGAACLSGIAAAQTVNPDAQATVKALPAGWPAWFGPMLNQALNIAHTGLIPMPGGTLPPPIVPQSEKDFNGTGILSTANVNGPTVTMNNAFFQSLGTNGRTCFSCHQMSSGMGLSTTALQNLYKLTGDIDPVFAAVDGANCPSTPHDHSILLNKGLFRIFLPVPQNAEFTVEVVSDPTGCSKNPIYNKDPATGAQIVSMYRRPFISTNLKFVTDLNPPIPPPAGNFDPLTGEPLPKDPYTQLVESGNIMWDGREPTLQSQAINATAGHAQATAAQIAKLTGQNMKPPASPPNSAQLKQIVDFENGLYSAQLTDNMAGSLTADGALGGAANLEATASAIPSNVAPPFTLYTSWQSASGAKQQSIYRGMIIYNNPALFKISNVSGFNNIPGVAAGGPSIPGGCPTCHSVPNSGSDQFRSAQHDIGVGGSSPEFGGPKAAMDLPIYKLTCKQGVTDNPAGFHTGPVYTNDPGAAMITGKCRDIGRLTVPQVRALASRAPYFSDGSAPTLLDVVNFYNKRFNIGLSDQDKKDLANFLAAL